MRGKQRQKNRFRRRAWSAARIAGAILLALSSLRSASQLRADKADSPEKIARSEATPSSYILGPDDLITIRVLEVPEIAEKPVRIDLDGNIEFPYIGQVRAAGRSVEQLKRELTDRLKSIVREPQVAVSIDEFRSQPVSVIG